MSQQQESVRLMQTTLIEMNEKLDRMISSINAINTRITEVESAVVQINAPSLPPKPQSPTSSLPHQSDTNDNDVRIYDEVQNAPAVPYRKKGKTFSTKQCEFMKLEMQEVRDYVDSTKSKNKDEKQKAQASLTSIISTFTLLKNYSEF
ncbi:uncharacterized protein LOC120348100 isoform X2 [Styela clava]|nr:uncharacterized protein LOC120348100 isoform X2 [Styela clava]